jgi:putative glutathione S-transferase
MSGQGETASAVREARAAGPVDFGTYGDYGDYRRPARPAQEARPAAEFVRAPYPFRGRITADGTSDWPAEAGRYHLYISWACPWAQRSAIVRRLLGLEDVVSLSVVDPVRDGRGWAFREGESHGLDEVNGFAFLREAYQATEPGYDGHISVPVLWDKKTSTIVSNHFPDITIDLDTHFGQWARPGVRLYPEPLRTEIDEINALVYENVNNGVYRCGFAGSQEAYQAAVRPLFETLDRLEERLASRRYLVGADLTEADVRLWVTLARFDSVYYSHFKCSIRRLTDYPNLWAYARDLYSRPAFRETTNFDHIKRHYFMTHSRINPTRIVPEGPVLDWTAPHDRARLG